MPQTAPTLPASVPTVGLGGLSVASQDLFGTLELLLDWLETPDGPTRRVATLDLATLRRAREDDELLACLQSADLVTTGSPALHLLASLAGEPLAGRVPTRDLVLLLLSETIRRGRRLALVSIEEGLPQQVVEVLGDLFPDLPPPVCASLDGQADDPDVVRRTLDGVRRAGAELVLVDLGDATSHRFLEQHLPVLGCRLALAVDGWFATLIGRRWEVPLLVEDLGLTRPWRHLVQPLLRLPRGARDLACLIGLARRAVALRSARTRLPRF